jgi:hypothetical protein
MTENDRSLGHHGGRKNRRVDLFLAALISHASVEEAATAAKLSFSTAWRYLRDPDVLTRLRSACRTSMRQSQALLQAASVESMHCLRKILRDGESQSVQVAAARTLLEIGLKAVELAGIEERIETLEAIARTHGWRGNDREYQTSSGKNRGVNGPA